jgi:DAK2 domain fusion protein YloV
MSASARNGKILNKVESYGGQELRDMFAAATLWLEKSASAIDALNVFPVPDGDTGTNMLLTMRSTVEEAQRVSDASASAVMQAMAHGALMGARGNSGVILSQIMRGLAKGLDGKTHLDGEDLALSLQEACSLAYKAISRPVEGTILTVLREAAEAARGKSNNNGDLISVMEATVSAARESVAKTPKLLPVLREADVVDAGGQGLYIILEGALRFLKGESDQMQQQTPQIIGSKVPLPITASAQQDEVKFAYGYCLEFLLKGDKLNREHIQRKLEKKGESVVMAGDENTMRVHLHTFDPGDVLRYATSQGVLHGVKIQNMDDQHRDYLARRKSLIPALPIAIVAVASGEGLVKVFRSLGVAAIVPGGQTMNPSTRQLLRAIELVSSDKVILLPNNDNIIPTAEQAKSLTIKKVKVVPTDTIPQGIAALLAFSSEADLEANVAAMEKARHEVVTLGLTKAVRSAKVSGRKVKKGQLMCFLNGQLASAADSVAEALRQAFAGVDLSSAEMLTIYYGAEASQEEAEQLAQDIRQKYPQIEVEVVEGGQMHYHYIISIE